MTNTSLQRIESIDVLRAITMLLMLWVNDFWTLSGIPNWLQRQAATDDALGFSDIIFPVFLFVVGLSIPFAISNRKRRGDTVTRILIHIAERSFALLLMGVFMVNLEHMPGELSIGGKYAWQIIMIIAFVLIWNAYPASMSKRATLVLKSVGYALLVVWAFFYKGPGEPASWMQAHWWGILGLIGWSYLIAAIVFLFWGHSYWLIGAAWAFLALFNIAEFAGFLSVFSDIKVYVWIVSSGFLFWIVDIKEKRQWWKPIGHAGTATLTCYLAPYIYYAIGGSLGLELPVFCAKEF